MWRLVVFLLTSGISIHVSQLRAAEDEGVAYAFLVAIKGYDTNELKSLPYTVAEMKEFREVLLASGYAPENVKLLCDDSERRYLPEGGRIIKELDLLMSRITSRDSLVVALNGHGLQFAGEKVGYFCPLDARVEDPKTMIAIDGNDQALFAKLKTCQSQRKLLLVNACRNDPLSNRGQASTRVRLSDLEEEPVPAGIAMLSSCKPGERSYYYDPTNPNGPQVERSLFFHHVIETWKSRGTNVTVDDLFSTVTYKVAADADNIEGRPQHPVKRREYEGEGEWYLRGQRIRLEPTSPDFPYTAHQAKQFQATYASYLGVPVTRKNSIGMELTLIPPGKFLMGSPEGEVDHQPDETQHEVTLTDAFLISTTEVTLAQFLRYYHDSPSKNKTEGELDGDGSYGYTESGEFKKSTEFTPWSPGWEVTQDQPVVHVSWNDAEKFCKWLTKKEGKQYRLLTEPEWEYACRAGTATAYQFGNEGEGLARVGNVADSTAKAKFEDWTWPIQATDGNLFTAPVGNFQRNAFGLADMHGNVWEWCENLLGDADQVIRGGSWHDYPSFCRSANRDWSKPDSRSNDLGFRVVCGSLQ